MSTAYGALGQTADSDPKIYFEMQPVVAVQAMNQNVIR